MHEVTDIRTMIAGLKVGATRSAQPVGIAKLTVLHRVSAASLPRGPQQEIRVLDAMLEPGDVTPRHSHRFPVTVYVTEGVFTLRLEGREPVRVRAGEVFVEPPGIPMIGCNEGEGPARTILFYVSDPDTPFADPLPI